MKLPSKVTIPYFMQLGVFIYFVYYFVISASSSPNYAFSKFFPTIKPFIVIQIVIVLTSITMSFFIKNKDNKAPFIISHLILGGLFSYGYIMTFHI